MKYLIQTPETVLVAFDNSSNELEYTLFKADDGGTIDIPSSWQDPHTSRADDVEGAIKMLAKQLGIDPSDTQEIEE